MAAAAQGSAWELMIMKRSKSHGKMWSLLLLLAAVAAGPLFALEPPEEPAAGRHLRGIAPGPEMDLNMSFSEELVWRFKSRSAGNRAGERPGMGHAGLQASGNPRILVLLLDFDDYPARPGDTPAAIRERIFGAGGEFPQESLSAYYRRASFGKLNIEGDVLGWYRAGRRADIPETREARNSLIKAALSSYKDHDFSQYDNDGDGVLDYVAVIWTGPTGEWASLWWGTYAWSPKSPFSVGGKAFGRFSWQGVSAKWEVPESGMSPRTLIHETGHALGLPDYYDYYPGVGPDGGLGTFDMMDSARYDHNCFSKFMLGWVEPRVVSSPGEYSLRPSSESGDCIMLVPGGKQAEPYSEFYLLENRRKNGNDADPRFNGGGLTIWHVDARLNATGTNFLYNNQNTEHKLLKLCEADGKEHLEVEKLRVYDALDFYIAGSVLGPGTVPSSRLYDGTETGIELVSKGGSGDVFFDLVYK